jgi:hypothetical protein
MKKTLLFKGFLFLFILILTQAQKLSGQAILYENFDYAVPAYIGGNGDAGASSNNWTTHSVTAGQTTTINIAAGNLTYTGLLAPTGNKVLLFSSANTTSRDINRAFTTTSTVLYFSALINVIDNSQLGTAGDYFMSFGSTAGISVPGLGARLGIKSVNTGSNFRLSILNISGGTTTFTDFAQDLIFGTTYLVVVKYDRAATPTVATLWVNPSTLGGSDPTGSVTNSSGTGTFATFASICLRNSATTPKVEIDEIRVGTTFADVTPLGSHFDPPVATFIPASASTDVLAWTKPTITFDEAILKTDGSAVTNTDLSTLITFKKTDASGADVPFSATIDAAKKVITVTPSANLDNSQLFYLAVGPVEDGFGNHSVLKSVTFTTISATTPVISLTYPAGGEKMYAGQSAIITWTSANIANVFIEVYAPDGTTRISSWISFVPSTPGTDGHADITVPADASYGTEYKIRVSDLSNPAVNSTGANFTVISVSPTLLDLRTRTIANDIVKYTGTATVTFTRPASGGYNQKYIQDATAALVIHDPSNFVGTYAVGDGITNIEGKMSPYLGLIEIVPQAATGTKTTGATIVPEVRTLASLTTADQAKLVKIENLKFTAPTGNFVTGTSYTLDGIAPTSLVFQTLFGEADYITTPTIVPVGYINAVVLVGEKSSVLYITPRNSADMSFATGIDNNLMKNIQLYPVPVLNELNIRNIQNIKGIEILDITGKTVMTMIGNDQTELQIPVSNLTRGMYFIKFTTAKGTVIKRFIK